MKNQKPNESSKQLQKFYKQVKNAYGAESPATICLQGSSRPDSTEKGKQN
jgi:hypothetical protein